MNGHGTDALYLQGWAYDHKATTPSSTSFHHQSYACKPTNDDKAFNNLSRKVLFPKNPGEEKWWEVKAFSKVLEANISEEFECSMIQPCISTKHFSTWKTTTFQSDREGHVTVGFRNSSVKLKDKDDQQCLSDTLRLNADINDGKIVDITALTLIL